MSSGIMVGSNRVSDEVRRAHSRAIRQRAQWRERYAVLSASIRSTKRRLAAAHKNNSVDRAAEIERQLEELKGKAVATSTPHDSFKVS